MFLKQFFIFYYYFYLGVKCDLNMQKGNAYEKKRLKVYAFESNKLYDVTTDLTSQFSE